MKEFHTPNQHYAMSILELLRIPADRSPEEDSRKTPVQLAEILCGDTCFLSSGQGLICLEFSRIAGMHPGDPIRHLIIIRSRDSTDRSRCLDRHNACVRSVVSTLRHRGYLLHEVPFKTFSQPSAATGITTWALRKARIQDSGLPNSCISLPIVDEVDQSAIYDALDGSGCSLTVQAIPILASPEEQQTMLRSYTQSVQAAHSPIPGLQTPLADSASSRWRYYAERRNTPMAQLVLMVSGSSTAVALVAARLRRSIPAPLNLTALDHLSCLPVYSLPWQLSRSLSDADPLPVELWSCQEAAQLLAPPLLGSTFVGLPINPHSYMPMSDLTPQSLTEPGSNRLLLGTCTANGKSIFLSHGALLLHSAIFGKSGSGKTTLLKQLIRQAAAQGVSVLILDPAKQEFRDLSRSMSLRVFTAESHTAPLMLNPFLPPDGVTMGQWTGQLLSVFKSTISMPDPLPSLFERAISQAYALHGWTRLSTNTDPSAQHFDLVDFIRIFRRVIQTSAYSNEVKGNMMSGGAFRLQSLLERCPLTFECQHSTPVSQLITGSVLVEMGRLEAEQKALVSILSLIHILSHLKANRTAGGKLQNIILIDEAHALLDQGHGSTEEEHAVRAAVSQLMLELITEFRAYGVAIIFADQSPHRIGSLLLDNVDNVISFRLSGEEARMMSDRLDGSRGPGLCIPLLETRNAILSNHLLRSPIPIRSRSSTPAADQGPVSDEELSRLLSESSPCPFSLCRQSGCTECSPSIRETARTYSAQILASCHSQLATPAQLAGHIIQLPRVLFHRGSTTTDMHFSHLCSCCALQLLRGCALSGGPTLDDSASETILQEMRNQINLIKKEDHTHA